MTGPVRAAVTLAVFAATLAMVVWRPRRWNEAWWTVLGATLMVGLGLVTPAQMAASVLAGKSALLFLLSLLLLSLLIGKSGFFDWAALGCARLAGGDARSLYRNTFLLGAIVTAVLSLDTTAVMLTPVVLALVRRLRVPAAPFIVLCAFVANVGSLLLPISNLTNLLFADTFRLRFGTFAAHMVAPQLVALAVTYALLRLRFRHELPQVFEARSLPAPASVVPHRSYFRTCVAVLALVLLGYFLAPLAGLEPYVVAFAGAAVLGAAGAVTGRVRLADAGELAWGVFPFVMGLFVCVRGLENLGLAAASSGWVARLAPGSTVSLLATAAATALASNVVNNLPAALIARPLLDHAHASPATVLAALVGTDVGPMITPFGSLATMLVLALARREGLDPPVGRLIALGAWTTPLILAATTLALALAP